MDQRRAGDDQPARRSPVPNLTPAREVPASLQQLWTAASPKTTMPLVVAGAVVTGNGRDVQGRDPVTGATAVELRP